MRFSFFVALRTGARSFSGSRSLNKLRTGIVGMPNVGKSTLFNALTASKAAEAANFPFCTIEPNTGSVLVPDPRLEVLAKINQSRAILHTSLDFVDIAGLVEGASKGLGLGNKFLANIRECDALVHVVRCFEDTNIVHVDGTVDPLRDAHVISSELMLADLAQVEKRLPRAIKQPTTPDEVPALKKLLEALEAGVPARSVPLTPEEAVAVLNLGMLSSKPVIYACNVCDEDLAAGNQMVERIRGLADSENAGCVVVSAQVESELAEMDCEEERSEFLEALGVDPSAQATGLVGLVRASYELLQLQTFFTSGETETRAWTIGRGWTAPQAAGVIHGDFEKKFIRVEAMGYEDLVALGSEKAVKEAGKLRSEGKEYLVKEGDVLHFLHGA